jgi:hypothetical protein
LEKGPIGVALRRKAPAVAVAVAAAVVAGIFNYWVI